MSPSTASQTKTPHDQSAPMPWVTRWLSGLPAGSRVLDWACGSGRHSLAAVACGHQVTAIDRNESALQALGERLAGEGGPVGRSQLVTVGADLEAGPWPAELAGSFDALIVTNYLFRPRLDLLCDLLAPGGRLIYATFARGNEQFGKPSNPDYLLQAGELLAVCARAQLLVLGYEHGQVSQPAPAMIQRVCAIRPDRDRALAGLTLPQA